MTSNPRSVLTAQAQGNGWLIDGELDKHDPEAVAEALKLVTATIAGKGGGRAEFWIHDVQDGDDAGPVAAGFTPYRDLWQLRAPLPAAPSNLIVRAFDPQSVDDLDAFIEVNNRAFSWHPEQGGQTRRDIEARMGEPWFRPEGFLLHEREGRLAGFCWTKVHAPDGDDPALGEIYVIAVDPDFHGQGLGKPMTLAGLEWLHAAGLQTAMLYVESDNTSANVVYQRIGFDRHRTDRAFETHVEPIA